MNSNISVKVTFKAYDRTNELIFPNEYTTRDLMAYLRNICYTFVIIDMTPTSKKPTI